jgi:hypothetical protein
MHDLVLARHDSRVLAVSGLQEVKQDTETDTPTISIQLAEPEEVGGLYTLRTQGLEAVGHRDILATSPGYCVDLMCGSLRRLADVVLSGQHRCEPGQTFDLGSTTMGFVEVPGDAEGEPPYLQIVDVPQRPMEDEEVGTVGDECDPCE